MASIIDLLPSWNDTATRQAITTFVESVTQEDSPTYVPPEARGKGIAQKLVEALVADAREQGFTIDPACSYVYALFKRHPEWADVHADGSMD